MKSILLQILTLDGLGYLKLAAYQTFLVVLWIQEMMLIQCISINKSWSFKCFEKWKKSRGNRREFTHVDKTLKGKILEYTIVIIKIGL